ncbi:MAG: endolytic transglycosylase MltG [Myxococcota bacterium]
MGSKKSKHLGGSKAESSTAALWLRLAAVVLVLIMGGAGFLWAHYKAFVQAPLLDDGESVTLVIPEGTHWPDLVSRLEAANLVKNKPYFEYWTRSRELPAHAKAGVYELEGPMTIEGLADALEEGGEVEEVRLTFPEGFTIFHIADRVEKAGLADRAAFLRVSRDEELLEDAGIDGESFEGYLFPDTYRFLKGTPPEKIVARMHERWRDVWDELEGEHGEELEKLKENFKFDRHDVVTLASIVEKESSANSERGLIARVFLNRIERNMRLQTDPTCVYGEDTYLEVPSPAYCKDKMNRYSTYVIEGLPPGPISNPGRDSLEAAIDPAEGDDAKKYLFFVARRDGSNTHYFSETYREHLRAIQKYLR